MGRNHRELYMVRVRYFEFVEWAYEGNPNDEVGVDGNPNRYNGSI